MVTGVIAMPLVMVMVMAVIQGVLVMHVRSIVSSAAQDGAVAAGRSGASVSDGIATTDNLLDAAVDGPLQHWSTTGATDGDRVTITVSGEVVSIVGFGAVDFTVSRTVRAERFRPQGSTP